MRYRAVRSAVFALVMTASVLSSQTGVASSDTLAKPFDWPMLASNEVGVQFYLRTRWADGALQYVATLADGKGRVAMWFAKHPDTGTVPQSAFQATFSDEAGFRLYTLYFYDRTFSRIEGTTRYEATGESRFTEKIYRAMLAAVKAADGSQNSSHGFNFPTELIPASPPKR